MIILLFASELFSNNLQNTTPKQLIINQANRLAINKELPDAIKLAEDLYKQYPDNQDVIQLNAKLYFWNSDTTTAYKYVQKAIDKKTKLYQNKG